MNDLYRFISDCGCGDGVGCNDAVLVPVTIDYEAAAKSLDSFAVEQLTEVEPIDDAMWAKRIVDAALGGNDGTTTG